MKAHLKSLFISHDQGMKLIIDWVANHTSPDNNWIEQGHLNWYTLDSIEGSAPAWNRLVGCVRFKLRQYGYEVSND